MGTNALQLLDEFERRQNPEQQSALDLLNAYEQRTQRVYGPVEPPKQAGPTLAPGVTGAVTLGLASLGQSVGGALEAFTPEGSFLSGAGAKLREAATPYVQPTKGYEDVNWQDPSDIVRWLSENVAAQIPNLAASTVSAGAGAGLGAMAGGALLGPPGAVIGGYAGGALGAGISSFLQNGGETYVNLIEKGVNKDEAATAAWGTGAMKAALDSAMPFRLGKQIFFIPKEVVEKAAAKGIPAIAKGLLKGALTEGIPEGMQELLDIWTEQWHHVPQTPGEAFSRVFNSVLVGAATGGLAEGVTTTAQEISRPAQVAPKGMPPPEMPPPEPKGPPTPEVVSPPTPPPVAPEPPAPVPPTAPTPQPKPNTVPAVAQHMKDVTLNAEGPAGLFKPRTDEEIRQLFGMSERAPLQSFVESGLLTVDKDGHYGLTELVTGKRGDYIVRTEPDPDFWHDQVADAYFYKYDPDTGSFVDKITKGQGADGNPLWLVTAPDGGITWHSTLGAATAEVKQIHAPPPATVAPTAPVTIDPDGTIKLHGRVVGSVASTGSIRGLRSDQLLALSMHGITTQELAETVFLPISFTQDQPHITTTWQNDLPWTALKANPDVTVEFAGLDPTATDEFGPGVWVARDKKYKGYHGVIGQYKTHAAAVQAARTWNNIRSNMSEAWLNVILDPQFGYTPASILEYWGDPKGPMQRADEDRMANSVSIPGTTGIVLASTELRDNDFTTPGAITSQGRTVTVDPKKLTAGLTQMPSVLKAVKVLENTMAAALPLLTGSSSANIRNFAKYFRGFYAIAAKEYYGVSTWYGSRLTDPQILIGINLVPTMLRGSPPEKTNANAFAHHVWGTFVHEMVHTAVMGHGDMSPTRAFVQTYNELESLLSPLRNNFIAQMEAIYAAGSGSASFSQEYLNGYRKLVEDAAYNPHQGPKTTRRPRRTPVGGSQGPPSTSVPGRGVGPPRTGIPGQERAGLQLYGDPSRVESRGDYPNASREYQELLHEHVRAGTSQYAVADTSDTESELNFAAVFDGINKQALVPGPQRKAGTEAIGKYFKFVRSGLTIIQLAKQYPNNMWLQAYLAATRAYWKTKTAVTKEADQLLREWYPLGKTIGTKLTDFIFEVMETSQNAKRRLTDPELLQIAGRHNLDAETLALWRKIDKSLQDTFIMLRDAQKAENVKVFGALLATIPNTQVDKEFAMMLNRNYFPSARFGNYAIKVKATAQLQWKGKPFNKGNIVEFSTFETERDAEGLYEKLQATYRGQSVEITRDWLQPHEKAFLSFPPVMMDLLADKLQLSQWQLKEARELVFTFAPGHSFVKHLKQKRGIAGYSQDAVRAYADYMQHASNHLAKISHRYELDLAARSLSKEAHAANNFDAGKLADEVEKHHSALLNPTSEYGWARGALFLWYFGGVLKQVVVNTTQLPMFAYPFLAEKMPGGLGKADTLVAVELGKAMRDTTSYILGKTQARLTADEKAAWQWAYNEGILDESIASEVAALAEGFTPAKIGMPYLGRLISNYGLDWKSRNFMSMLTKPFRVSEEGNRRATFLAAYRLARKNLGQSHEQALVFGRDAVDTTMFEYARWNRPRVMRGGPKALIFVFKMFSQHALHFAVTGQGGARFWVMSALLAGVAGLPFAEDLLALFDLAGAVVNRFTGWKNWRVDAEQEIRELVHMLGVNPDFVMNGAARETFGLTVLNTMFGAPVPELDFSMSMQTGILQPLLDPTAKVVRGEQDLREGFLDIAGGLLGAGFSTFFRMSEAALNNSESSVKYIRAMPAGIKNLVRAADYVTKGSYRNSKGQPLVDFDVSNPTHVAEIMGQLLGVTPTRVTRRLAADAQAREMLAYWYGRKESLLTEYALAIKDREALADVRAKMKSFNENAPKELAITYDSLVQSVEERVKNNTLRTRGLPTQGRFRELYLHQQELLGLTPSQ